MHLSITWETEICMPGPLPWQILWEALTIGTGAPLSFSRHSTCVSQLSEVRLEQIVLEESGRLYQPFLSSTVAKAQREAKLCEAHGPTQGQTGCQGSWPPCFKGLSLRRSLSQKRAWSFLCETTGKGGSGTRCLSLAFRRWFPSISQAGSGGRSLPVGAGRTSSSEASPRHQRDLWGPCCLPGRVPAPKRLWRGCRGSAQKERKGLDQRGRRDRLATWLWYWRKWPTCFLNGKNQEIGWLWWDYWSCALSIVPLILCKSCVDECHTSVGMLMRRSLLLAALKQLLFYPGPPCLSQPFSSFPSQKLWKRMCQTRNSAVKYGLWWGIYVCVFKNWSLML